ncbi:hypothetical protein [Streptomyces sp. NBC_00576]|nr:hypothetical protein [Streptomyces sp. NBC_00576]WUB70059.1 hypothetical protein OG734_08230 [Streptomyces sp. NBC_00576]
MPGTDATTASDVVLPNRSAEPQAPPGRQQLGTYIKTARNTE